DDGKKGESGERDIGGAGDVGSESAGQRVEAAKEKCFADMTVDNAFGLGVEFFIDEVGAVAAAHGVAEKIAEHGADRGNDKQVKNIQDPDFRKKAGYNDGCLPRNKESDQWSGFQKRKNKSE
ncbi:MAG: hypothetical protein WC873_04570, partial [Candidatus Gracilibacteria bacterium]